MGLLCLIDVKEIVFHLRSTINVVMVFSVDTLWSGKTRIMTPFFQEGIMFKGRVGKVFHKHFLL